MNTHSPTKKCSDCKGTCCKTMPGTCCPSDISKMFPSSSLKKSVETALKTGNFSIDWYEDEIPLYYVRPATIIGKNKIYDPSWGGSPCVFLTPKGCTIVKNKPLECKLLKPKTNSSRCSNKFRYPSKQVFGRLWRRKIDLSCFENLIVNK